jgi:hypothetical protein
MPLATVSAPPPILQQSPQPLPQIQQQSSPANNADVAAQPFSFPSFSLVSPERLFPLVQPKVSICLSAGCG